jgi:hypothetical protein
MRRFPPPWTLEAPRPRLQDRGRERTGTRLVYGHADPRDARIAKSLTLHEARRIAAAYCAEAYVAKKKIKKLDAQISRFWLRLPPEWRVQMNADAKRRRHHVKAKAP